MKIASDCSLAWSAGREEITRLPQAALSGECTSASVLLSLLLLESRILLPIRGRCMRLQLSVRD